MLCYKTVVDHISRWHIEVKTKWPPFSCRMTFSSDLFSLLYPSRNALYLHLSEWILFPVDSQTFPTWFCVTSFLLETNCFALYYCFMSTTRSSVSSTGPFQYAVTHYHLTLWLGVTLGAWIIVSFFFLELLYHFEIVQVAQQPSIGLFWCLFPILLSNTGNKHQNSTLDGCWATCQISKWSHNSKGKYDALETCLIVL